jgi:ubiquinone/menaquinone biosynthesis C-methylase UbiE
MVRETYYGPLAGEIASELEAGRILDLGTGPGLLPVEIARRSPRIRIDGIDLTPRLIRMAELRAAKAGVSDRVRFEVGNASRLRWPDNTFDMVISTGMLHTVKDPEGVLGECRRVLKPGGRAWIFDPARVSSHIDTRKWKASFTLKERILYGLFLVYARINPGRVYSREQVISMIRAGGFRTYFVEAEGREIRAKMTKSMDG